MLDFNENKIIGHILIFKRFDSEESKAFFHRIVIKSFQKKIMQKYGKIYKTSEYEKLCEIKCWTHTFDTGCYLLIFPQTNMQML